MDEWPACSEGAWQRPTWSVSRVDTVLYVLQCVDPRARSLPSGIEKHLRVVEAMPGGEAPPKSARGATISMEVVLVCETVGWRGVAAAMNAKSVMGPKA